MLLGLRSALFIGNPTSSFSRTVAAVRKVASRSTALGLGSGESDSRSNLAGDYIRNF